jgi:hypothetical protein
VTVQHLLGRSDLETTRKYLKSRQGVGAKSR